ncbi:hypothetical protein [Phenylobacterium sp.]|uniref:hypothetical protein n=1 Tax=Phenylobacterium sp. TaxID=1871053 RepID=UPI0040371A65
MSTSSPTSPLAALFDHPPVKERLDRGQKFNLYELTDDTFAVSLGPITGSPLTLATTQSEIVGNALAALLKAARSEGQGEPVEEDVTALLERSGRGEALTPAERSAVTGYELGWRDGRNDALDPDRLAADRTKALEEEVHLLEEVCAFYANDEDQFLDDGEPYGTIPTEVGLKARSARSRFMAREAALAPSVQPENGDDHGG